MHQKKKQKNKQRKRKSFKKAMDTINWLRGKITNAVNYKMRENKMSQQKTEN